MLVKWTEDLQQRHTQNIVIDSDACDTCQNMSTAMQVHRCCKILQNPSSLRRCTEQWLAHDWRRKGTSIARGGRSGKQAANHQRENAAGSQRIKGIFNARRNVYSTLQIDCDSVCSVGSDCRDDRHGLDIQCKSTRNYEWTDM